MHKTSLPKPLPKPPKHARFNNPCSKSPSLLKSTRQFKTQRAQTSLSKLKPKSRAVRHLSPRLFSTTPDAPTVHEPVIEQQYLSAKSAPSAADQAKYQQMMNAQRLQMEAAQKNGDVDDFDDDNIPLTAEELFYEMPPLSSDMFELEPRCHRGTLIWLPDCFETHQIHGKSFQMLMAKELRVVVPNPPIRECTVLGGEEQKAWYDVMSVPFKAEQCDLDYTGMKLSMYLLHQLIRDEALRVGAKVAPFNAPPEEIERLGSERIFLGGFGQGAALATFAGLRYPQKLAGIISHSGYIPFIDQTAEAARLLEQQQRKEWELTQIEQTQFDQAQHAVGQTVQEHLQVQSSKRPPAGEKTSDISSTAPNLRTPLYVAHNTTDSVFPWCELAQPSFIKAAKAPLKCKLILRMGKSEGHSIASLDLLDLQFWTAEVLGEKERNMPAPDTYEREKIREMGEFGDSIIVVDKYSTHSDRVTMPWTSPRVLESANVANQDIKRVEELLKLIPKHPERLEEIANEIELLNNEADEELWKAYLVEAQQFVKTHQKYIKHRHQQFDEQTGTTYAWDESVENAGDHLGLKLSAKNKGKKASRNEDEKSSSEDT